MRAPEVGGRKIRVAALDESMFRQTAGAGLRHVRPRRDIAAEPGLQDLSATCSRSMRTARASAGRPGVEQPEDAPIAVTRRFMSGDAPRPPRR